MTKVAFIGLGTMGLAMAGNIIKGGHSVTGFDASADAMESHRNNGGDTAASAAEATDGAEVVFSMLPNGKIVHQAIFGEGGAVHGMADGAILVDMSTISPSETDGVRAGLAEKGFDMVDAPVGRTSDNAKTGTSLFMVGGAAETIAKVRHLLDCMGDTVIDCGGPGMGTRMKIVNNLMSTTTNAVTAQILNFSDALGLDRDLSIEVMSGTPAGKGHMSTTYPAKVLKGDLSPAFMVNLAKKDLDIALVQAEELGVPLTVSKAAAEVYVEAQEAGRGTDDWTTLYDMLRKT